jgi:hypothetical protein
VGVGREPEFMVHTSGSRPARFLLMRPPPVRPGGHFERERERERERELDR